MEFKVGDYVTRNSYQNDLIFRITKIKDDIYYLTGVNIRLCADSNVEDLKKCDRNSDSEDVEFIKNIEMTNLNRDDYFYLPGKILHIDADSEYLERCLKYYEKSNIWAAGILESEKNIPNKIEKLLEEYRPDIVVITGHDAYYKKSGEISDLNSYKNSCYYVEAIKNARKYEKTAEIPKYYALFALMWEKYEKSHEKLIIIAGGCQSDYEELIKAGANFASSPKRINIHALDPAIIASKLSLSDVTQDIDLKGILEKIIKNEKIRRITT